MRTWEKIWWVFVFSVLGIFLVGIWMAKEDKILFKVYKEGKLVDTKYISKGTACLYAALFVLGIGLVLWLIFKGIAWLLGK